MTRWLAVTLLAVTACTTTRAAETPPPAAPHATEPSTVTMAATYQRIVAPANRDVAAFAKSVRDGDTGPQVAAKARPLITALRSLDNTLLTTPWTAAIEQDMRQLVIDDRLVEGVLGEASDQSASSASSWGQQLTAALAKVSADVSLIHADLGLPPTKG